MMRPDEFQPDTPFLHVTWMKTCTVLARFEQWVWITDDAAPWTEDITDLGRCAVPITPDDPKVQVQVPVKTVESDLDLTDNDPRGVSYD